MQRRRGPRPVPILPAAARASASVRNGTLRRARGLGELWKHAHAAARAGARRRQQDAQVGHEGGDGRGRAQRERGGERGGRVRRRGRAVDNGGRGDVRQQRRQRDERRQRRVGARRREQRWVKRGQRGRRRRARRGGRQDLQQPRQQLEHRIVPRILLRHGCAEVVARPSAGGGVVHLDSLDDISSTLVRR